MTGLVFGAYAAAPRELSGDRAAESEWFARLRDQPVVGGLELAWTRELDAGGAPRLAALLDPRWSSVVTMMAGVAERMKADPHYGLASDRDESRALAVADVAAAHREIVALRSELGPDAVRAIEVQSAPSSGAAAASPRAFTQSLREILDLDWDGVAVVVEHCDASDGVSPQKSFLPLAAEVSSLDAAAASRPGPSTGHAVNWARSVIERRSADGAEPAIRLLAGRGRLAGLMFSGVAPVATAFGREWADSHLPVADGGLGSEPGSLLTAERVARALSLAGPHLGYLGAKVAAPKVPDLTFADRLAPGLATLGVIARAAAR